MAQVPDVLSEMAGAWEYVEGSPVKLGRQQPADRLVVRAYNEGGNDYTDVDLFDLAGWLRGGPSGGSIADGDFDK